MKQKKRIQKKLSVAICVPAYNEGNNIKKILDALLSQVTKKIKINKIVVVSSGSTDDTDQIVKKYCKKYQRCLLIRQPSRMGKAAAINAFLKTVSEEVVVIESADTIPRSDTIEKLCAPLIKDKTIGMTGGAPIPVNDPNTFLGYIIHTWWWFHRHIPRFGEIIAYRNILENISPKTAVDEAFIQAKLIQMGYKIVHVDSAIVRNKGPETLTDLIRQRRRIFNGHVRLYETEKVKINNMTKTSLKLLLFDYKIKSVTQFFWFHGGLVIEVYARLLGAYDTYHKKINPYIWDTATSTKNLKKDIKRTVVLLNFAPIQFMGGAERWMHEVSSVIADLAKTVLVDVHPSIANIYGRIVLKHPFHARVKKGYDSGKTDRLSLTWSAFLPFTDARKKARYTISSARLVYIRYELLETLIVVHLGGLKALRKTVAGIHSAFYYRSPVGFFDKLHNYFYLSGVSKFFLSKMKKIHVLNMNDKDFFRSFLPDQTIVYVPNYVMNKAEKKVKRPSETKPLHILFVGELSFRKGVDRLIDTISRSRNNLRFHIAGDGPMKKDIKRIARSDKVTYHGYLKKNALRKLYSKSDVLFMPSRAESLSLVALEAMSHSLPIVSSRETDMKLPSYIQYVNNEDTSEEYIKLFDTLLRAKEKNLLHAQRNKIQIYAEKTFTKQAVIPNLVNNVFETNAV